MLAEPPQNGERRNPEDEQASKSEGQGQVCGQGQSEGQSPCCNKVPERGPKEGPAEGPELKAPERGAEADEEELEEARQGGKFGGEGAGPCKRSQHRRGGGVAGPGRPQQARQEQVVEPAPDPHEQQPRGQGAAGEAGQESQGCSGDTVVPSRQGATVRELLRNQGGGHDLEKGRQVVVGEGSFEQMDGGRA